MDELCEYAQAEFKLDKKPKDSEATLREHLTAVYEQTNIKPEQLNNPEPDPFVLYLLDYFRELSMSRQCGMTINPILYSEIEAWSRLTATTLEKWELDTLKRLDVIWLNVQVDE
ncbi:hypothetical protein FHQ28_05665 [Pasteurellaceae bacterium USgator11]|nr:hypothetical protein FHQ20_07925 [Pasteurellaceae bacterium USgator41]TNG96483.1 hypothetical protein FHQ19_02100 [Pasteurellaceae bacterium UScroc12]TNH00435.1 hypothetical protein FHQ24_03525 [Pasteurellaceae bacterium UScroc31]TNH01734.1 hypothetical protein FHQ28_05665 [Pasteurellaceae bacterium USgator11]